MSYAVDRLIAEEVMGWRLSPLGFWASTPVAVVVSVADWSPTTRWDHAGMVVEHMHALGWYFLIQLTNREVPDPAYARFERPDPTGIALTEVHGADAATVPLAICLAALKAISTKEKKP